MPSTCWMSLEKPRLSSCRTLVCEDVDEDSKDRQNFNWTLGSCLFRPRFSGHCQKIQPKTNTRGFRSIRFRFHNMCVCVCVYCTSHKLCQADKHSVSFLCTLVSVICKRNVFTNSSRQKKKMLLGSCFHVCKMSRFQYNFTVFTFDSVYYYSKYL